MSVIANCCSAVQVAALVATLVAVPCLVWAVVYHGQAVATDPKTIGDNSLYTKYGVVVRGNVLHPLAACCLGACHAHVQEEKDGG